MAAPVAAFVQLPTDSGNTGKKVRTQSRVVGSDTVHEHYFISGRQALVTGVYRCAFVQSTVLAAAQNGTTAGMLFMHMPSASTTRAARLRRFSITSQHSTALATPTAPRILLRKFTSAGALNTSLITGTKVDSTMAAHSLLLSLVNTGTTVVHDGIGVGAAGLAGALTAVGAYEPCYKDIVDPASDEDEWTVMRPGEGLVAYQDTAGTTSDTRKFSMQMLWDEVDIS